MATLAAIRIDTRLDDSDIAVSTLDRMLATPLPATALAASEASHAEVPTIEIDDAAGHAAKRLLDIVISLVALILLAPVMLLVALAVRLNSPGPVLFVQERVGEGGHIFRMLKFRSMQTGTDTIVTTDELERRRYAKNDFKLAADDPRITSVGRFIRLTSLDELPQLVNVLKGDMSIVGIRPIVADQLATRSAYDQACYRAMKPGMTGLWQVSGRSSVTSHDRDALDRRYVETWSVLNDLKVLVRTPVAVLNTANTR